MQVILLSNNNNKLGKIGDIVTVKNGYARNCLFPRSIALPATKDNKEKFDQIKKEIESKKLISSSIFNKVANHLTDNIFKFIEKSSDEGKLFGSVTPKMIAKALSDKITAELKIQNFKINHFNLFIPNAIKECGLFHVFYGPEEERFRFFVSVGSTQAEADKNAILTKENDIISAVDDVSAVNDNSNVSNN
ncbi:MAG: 50S ribosomal protein L9 [Rickettsiales bacterium]